jgi:hypothetical protein
VVLLRVFLNFIVTLHVQGSNKFLPLAHLTDSAQAYFSHLKMSNSLCPSNSMLHSERKVNRIMAGSQVLWMFYMLNLLNVLLF